jgi:hypothetical protein
VLSSAPTGAALQGGNKRRVHGGCRNQHKQRPLLMDAIAPRVEGEAASKRILQPVLSWGPISDVPGSGPFWTIASWYVGNPGEPFYLTQPKRVNPGQKLTGRITMYYNGGGLFDYGCEFVGIDGTKLIAGNLPQLVRQLKRSRPISLRAIATIQIRREQLSPAYRFGAAAIPFTLNGARAAYSPISFRSRREELK